MTCGPLESNVQLHAQIVGCQNWGAIPSVKNQNYNGMWGSVNFEKTGSQQKYLVASKSCSHLPVLKK